MEQWRGEEEEEVEAGRQASQEMEAERGSIIRIAGGVWKEEDEGRHEEEEEKEEGGVKQRKQREGQQHLESLCPF